MEDDEKLVCLVCDAGLNVSSSFNIFSTTLARNGEILVNFVLRILHPGFNELRSSFLCPQCYELFRTLEEAQRTATDIKNEILRVYASRNTPSDERNEKNTDKSTNYEDDNHYDINEIKNVLELAPNDEAQVNSITNAESFLPTSENQKTKSASPKNLILKGKEESLKDSSPQSQECTQIVTAKGVAERAQEIKVENEIQESSVDQVEETEQQRVKIVKNNGKCSESNDKSQKALKYDCQTCKKKWRTLAELRTHERSHSTLRPYMCEKCGQAYKHKNALEIHVGMHNGVSPYKCSVCDKCFTQKGALMRHLPMHTGEFPYQCELCGKRFVHHTSYNMHILSHTGKKSYQCRICDLSLLSTSHLKRHMRVHTGEKPYSCSLCGKSFAERYNLFAHQKIHDPDEIMARAAKKMTFKCNSCDQHFDSKEKVDKHRMEHDMKDKNGDFWRSCKIDDTDVFLADNFAKNIDRTTISENEISGNSTEIYPN